MFSKSKPLNMFFPGKTEPTRSLLTNRHKNIPQKYWLAKSPWCSWHVPYKATRFCQQLEVSIPSFESKCESILRVCDLALPSHSSRQVTEVDDVRRASFRRNKGLEKAMKITGFQWISRISSSWWTICWMISSGSYQDSWGSSQFMRVVSRLKKSPIHKGTRFSWSLGPMAFLNCQLRDSWSSQEESIPDCDHGTYRAMHTLQCIPCNAYLSMYISCACMPPSGWASRFIHWYVGIHIVLCYVTLRYITLQIHVYIYIYTHTLHYITNPYICVYICIYMCVVPLSVHGDTPVEYRNMCKTTCAKSAPLFNDHGVQTAHLHSCHQNREADAKLIFNGKTHYKLSFSIAM